jgi:hypothetical protein
MLCKKTELRALMEVESRKIAEAIPHLSAAETEQLQAMLAGEAAACDADVPASAKQVEAEASLAASTRAMDVRIDRQASRALQAEMLRRIEAQGLCPAASQLTGEAIRRVYGR